MALKQLGINPDNRRTIADSKRRSGFSPEQVDYRDFNEGLFSVVQEHILGTSVQLSANDCTIKYDPSDNSFRDKNGGAVVFAEGDRITIIGLDMTEAVDITTDKIIVRQDPTTSIDTSTYTLTFSGDSVNAKIFATVKTNVLFIGSGSFYIVNGESGSVNADIQFISQPDHIILTSAKQALYGNDDKILRVDADGVTFKRRDNTTVSILDNTIVAIDSTEQLTNDLHFSFDNSDIEILRQFEIDTNGNKVFIDGDKCRVSVFTTEDFDNGLEAETEEDQRVVKNRGIGNIIGLNGRKIFSGSMPIEINSPVLILDPYIISQNGDSFEGFKVSGSNDDVCLFTDWWKHWGGLDIASDGSILVPPVFNPATGVLQRRVFTDDPAGRLLRYNTPIGGSADVDPGVHSRTSPIIFGTISTYTSSASAEISGITDADALKLKIGARVADAGLSIPQGSSGTPKTTIISSIIHNGTNDNSIFLIDSETGGDAVVSATGNLTIDMSGNSGISRQLDAMQRITGTLTAGRNSTNIGTGVFTTAGSTGLNGNGSTTLTGIFSFNNAGSTSPNAAKTNDDESRVISYQRQPYLIL